MKASRPTANAMLLALALAVAGVPSPAQARPGLDSPGMGPPGLSQQEGQDAEPSQAQVDDATLQRQVHEELSRRGELANVHVTVKNGIVHLEGSVPGRDSRKQARDLAESVPGVRGVKEKLTIDPNAGAAATSTTGAEQTGPLQPQAGAVSANPQVSAQVQKDIHDALQANPELSGVNVQVSEDSVVLTGSVASNREEEQALSITQAHAGGRTVFNRMTLTEGR